MHVSTALRDTPDFYISEPTEEGLCPFIAAQSGLQEITLPTAAVEWVHWLRGTNALQGAGFRALSLLLV